MIDTTVHGNGKRLCTGMKKPPTLKLKVGGSINM